MLKKLKYKVQFLRPDGSRGFGTDATFEFQEGLTSITGPNGHGKSLIPEMIQFAYWGISALRGKSDDYKDLDVEHEFFLKGQPYTVCRTISSAKLFEGHADENGKGLIQVAAGTKAVNQTIRERFGYSKDVFQVANAINQKKVDEFCEMLPTARKKLVDETIGLSALDALVKWIAEQELSIKAQIGARATLLVAPVEPVRPEAYTPSEEITKKLQWLYMQRRDRDIFAAQANQTVAFPPLVTLETDDALLDQYQSAQQTRNNLLAEAMVLQRQINEIPAFTISEDAKLEDDDALMEQYQTEQTVRNDMLSRRAILVKQFEAIPSASLTAEQLDRGEADLALLARWMQKNTLMQHRVPHTCPKCEHHWHDEDPRLKTEFADVPEEKPIVVPGMDAAFILQQRNILSQQGMKQDLDRQIFEIDEFLSVNPDRTARIQAIAEARRIVEKNAQAIRTKTRYDELKQKYDALIVPLAANPDMLDDIKRISDKRHAVALYTMALSQAQKKQQEVDAAKAALTEFPAELDSTIATHEAARNTSLVYETNLAAYATAKVKYDEEMVKQAELEDELKAWSSGKQAVGDLRTKVKGFLLPSLNKVASYLINEFTGGELSWLVVNDEFEVIVDGQRVETLSGAGKTVANLAIRIGLGQVLTSQVFSVLMLDEADESCDDSRASFIEKMLVNLKSQLKQIIQITHKVGGQADHHIRL